MECGLYIPGVYGCVTSPQAVNSNQKLEDQLARLKVPRFFPINLDDPGFRNATSKALYTTSKHSM